MDLSLATYDNVSISTVGQTGGGVGIAISTDGTKLFAMGSFEAVIFSI